MATGKGKGPIVRNSLWEIQRERDRRGKPHGRRGSLVQDVLPPKLSLEGILHRAAELDRECQQDVIQSLLGNINSEPEE